MHPPAEKFGRVTIVVHWVTAIGVLISAIIGLISVYTNDTETTRIATAVHQSIGITLFTLVIFRSAWRLTHAVPPPVAGTPPAQQLAANAVHALLYVILFALPITGYTGLAARGRDITIFGLFDLPHVVPLSRTLSVNAQNLHMYLQYALYALVLLHVGAALYHYYIMKDGLLRRMWGLRA